MPTIYLNEIRIDETGLPEVVASLSRIVPEFKDAVKNTVNRTINFAMEETITRILDRYEISRASLLDQSSRHGRTKWRPKYATDSNLAGGFEIKGTRMPVMRFTVIPTSVPNQLGVPVAARPVVTVIVKRGSAQIGQPNVFLARMRSGHTGVYRRKIPNPGGPRRRRPDRQNTQLPITEEYMLSVPEMMSGNELRTKFDENVSEYAMAVWQEEEQKAIRRVVRRMALEALEL